MRVLLVIPTFKYAIAYPEFLSISDFPTGFAYIAAALKQAGHEVFGLNPNNIVGYVSAEFMLKDVLTKRLKEIQPELVGLGGLCTDYKFLKDAIGIIRAFNPVPIVLGGQIVTNDAEDAMKILQPDYGIAGEGEWAITQLAAHLAEGSDNFLGKGQVSFDQVKRDIDSYPLPDYEPFGIQDMLDNFSMATRLLYRYSRPDPRPFGIVTARGCPFSCTFCTAHQSYRPRSMPAIIEELRITYERYHYNILIILDELFAVNKERMNEFSEAVIECKSKYGWDFDWMFQTHASAKLDLESLKLAKKAGCFFFSYGLESASPVVLKSMDKKIQVCQVIEAIKLAEEAKIGFGANLIFGDIAETRETYAESIAFWLTYCKSSFVFLSSLSPYPGSAVFEACRKKGMFKDKQKYYETIDQAQVNITSIPDRDYAGLKQMTQALEGTWLFTKSSQILKCEEVPDDGLLLRYLGGDYYKITAQCPYCESEVVYKERLADAKTFFWIGTGCPECGRKIKVVKE